MKTKILAILATVLISGCVLIPVSAYAADGIITKIVSDQTVVLAIGITIVGITLKAITAILKHGVKEYDYRMTIVSFIMGFLVSLQMVTTSMEHLPIDAPATVYLTIIVGEISTVMGIDSGAKAVGTKLGLVKPKEEKTNASE